MKKTAVITGASRGIGYDTALVLANTGHQVLALSRNKAALKKLSEEAEGNINYLPFDLVNGEYRLLEEQLAEYGAVDILINNAGYLINKPFMELSEEDWSSLLGVNLLGPVRLIRLLEPYLSKSSHAHVVNIGSMGGFQGSGKFPGLSGYSASKAALANLTECLAEEWKEKNITCNCLALGAVQTEMLAAAFPGFEASMTSPQMARYIARFAEEGHLYYNGKVLPVSASTP